MNARNCIPKLPQSAFGKCNNHSEEDVMLFIKNSNINNSACEIYLFVGLITIADNITKTGSDHCMPLPYLPKQKIPSVAVFKVPSVIKKTWSAHSGVWGGPSAAGGEPDDF